MEDTERDEQPGETARGPRLPDIPWLAWVFILLALGESVRSISEFGLGSDPTIEYVVAFVLGLTPAIASILLPAAVLISHRNAMRVAPTLLFGTILVASVQGLQLLADPLQPVFESLTPASEEIPDFVPLATLFNAVTFLVLVIGLAYIALGLSMARRREDAPGDVTGLIVPVASVVATVGGVIEISRLGYLDATLSPWYLVYLGSSFIPGVLQVALWAYLLAVAIRGFRAGEAPRRGWQLGSVAGGFVLVAFALIYVTRIFDLEATFGDPYLYVVATGYALGYLTLLLAFVVGLPATDVDEEDDIGEDEDAYEVEEELDEGGWPIATGPGG